nr:hypothetical protein Ch529 [Colletotrichum horii]
MKLAILPFAPVLANAVIMYCDHGYDGNGECEKQGFYTYCCHDTYATPQFTVPRDVKMKSKDHWGANLCYWGGEHTFGSVYCG